MSQGPSPEEFRLALSTGNYHHVKDGVSLTLNRWVGFLLHSNVRVRVYAPAVPNPDVQHVGELEAVPSFAIPGRAEYRVSKGLSRHNRASLEAFQPHLVHIATPDPAGFQMLKWARKRDIPVVASFHTNFASYYRYYNLSILSPPSWLYFRWFYNRCRHVYVPTPSMAKELVEHGIDKDRLRLSARGVDLELFHPSKRTQDQRTELGFTPDTVVVTFVSRLVLEKNVELFCRVVKELKRTNPQVGALVVGEGPARQRMESMLPDAVFTGRLTGEELARAYACSDIFFFPSVTETFGNVTLEAMASGLPCVVAKAAGGASLIDHGNTGYTVSVRKEEASIRKLDKLITDPQLRRQMGETSRSKAETYNWPRIHSELLSFYRQVIKQQLE